MDYEKKYKDALERAIVAYKDEDRHLKATLERIFPELKESKDEKIRKMLIRHIEQEKGSLTNDEAQMAIDWIEKQKYAITCSEEQMKVLNEVLNFAANHESPHWNYYIFETLNNLIRQLKN